MSTARKVVYYMSLVDKMSTQMERVEKRMEKTTRAFEKSGKRMQKSMNSVGKVLKGIATIEIGKAIFNASAGIEDTRIKFEKLTRSREKGAKIYEKLTKLSNRTPLQNEDVYATTEMLLAYGVQVEKTTGLTRRLGDIALGNGEKMKSLARAFGQISAKGRLMGQELMQMTEHGFNPLMIIAKKTGVTYSEMQKRMEAGMVSVKDVEEAIISATSKGGNFNNVLQAMSNTMSGKWSTVLGSGKQLVGELGLRFKSATIRALDLIQKMIDWASKNKDTIESIIKLTAQTYILITAQKLLAKSILLTNSSYKGFIKMIKLARRGQVLFNNAVKANIYAAIATAVLALGYALYEAWKTSKRFREVLKGSGYVIADGFIYLKVKAINAMLDIGSHMYAMYKTAGYIWDSIKRYIASVFDFTWISNKLDKLSEKFSNVITKIGEAPQKIAERFARLGVVISKVAGKIYSLFQKVFEKIFGFFPSIADFLSPIGDWIVKLIDKISNPFKNVDFGVIDHYTKMLDNFNKRNTRVKVDFSFDESMMKGLEPTQKIIKKKQEEVNEYKTNNNYSPDVTMKNIEKSGALKNYNITIQRAIGVENLHLGSVKESEKQVENSLLFAVNRSLSDLKIK